MRPLNFEERTLVLGITFHGKSHFVKRVLLPESGYAKRAIFWDLRREYPRDVPGTLSLSVEEFTKFASEHRHEMRDHHKPLLVAVHPAALSSEDGDFQAWEFGNFIRVCEASVSDALIVIDECGQFEDNRTAQAKLNYLATQSRHWLCPAVFIAQCAVQVPKIARRQCTRVYSFRQNDEIDMRALRTFFGDKALTLNTLAKGQYYSFDAGSPEVTPDKVQGKLF